MALDERKMVLSKNGMAEAVKAHKAAAKEFLDPAKIRANVVGLGVGVKWTQGQPTGDPALIVLVAQKVEKSLLSSTDVVPSKLGGMQTDVLAIGYPFAGGGTPPGAGIQTLAKRIRPARGGWSVGHVSVTAGTIATCVYDLLPGGTVSPPAHGVGIPPKYYILSNNHVLANTNAGSPGDPVLQPGAFDGGTDPGDRIATLSRFIPIALEPPMPKAQHRNLVDASVAEGQFHDLEREISWIGAVHGWRLKKDVLVGLVVKKTGRTTNFTTGRITTVNATVDVGYSGGRVARFMEQIVTTGMSAGGDSGSLVVTVDPHSCCTVAIGLLFAGSALATIVNQIENVRSLLRVEVAEQVL